MKRPRRRLQKILKILTKTLKPVDNEGIFDVKNGSFSKTSVSVQLFSEAFGNNEPSVVCLSEAWISK